jgi:predicted amidohydrolase YtcJ
MISKENMEDLVDIPVTLNGEVAFIKGTKLPFGIIRNVAGEEYVWSWNAIARIVSQGGNFYAKNDTYQIE